MKFFKKIIVPVLIFSPMVSFAAGLDIRTSSNFSFRGGGGLWNLFGIVIGILDQVVILLIALAVVFFIYGIVKFIKSADEEEGREKGKNIMFYGIIGLFVMVSVWGIVNILINTFELDTFPFVDVPYFYGDGGSSSSSIEGTNL